MPKVPTLLSSGDVRTGQVAALSTAFQGPGSPSLASFAGAEAIASAGRSVGGGLMDVAGGIDRRMRIDAEATKQRAAYDNHMWSESNFTTAQRDWIQWTEDVQKNGSEDVVGQFNEKFADYQSKLLAAAPNEDARNRLKLRMDDLGTQIFDKSLKIEAVNRSQNAINLFTGMLQDTVDSVSKDPELYAVPQHELLQNLKLAREQNRITEPVYQKLVEQAQNISVVAAEALVVKDPDYAKEIIDNAQGIDWSRRKAVLSEIEHAKASNDTLYRYEQSELLKSHLDSIMDSGVGARDFSIDRYVASFPKDHQGAARAEALSRVDVAKNLFVGKTQLQGQPPDKIPALIEKYRPESGDANFNDRMTVYQKLSEFADQQVKLFQKDPFTYSRQDPVVDKAWRLVEELPKDAKPELVQQLTQQALEASISYQKNAGIPDGRLSAMSQGAASRYAEQINRGDTKQVQDSFARLEGIYGKYYPQAFRDLVRLPEGQRIDAAMQVVALHMGQPFLTDYIAAVRAPLNDMRVDPKDYQQLKDRLVTDPTFMAFRGAMLSANAGAVPMVDDFHDGIAKYAQQMLFRGKAKNPGDAVQQSVAMVIGSAYGFATVDGTPVAVKRQQGKTLYDDESIATIGRALGQFQRTIPSERVDVTRFGFPANVSEDMRKRSVDATIKNDSFWVTNPQNDGAVLYMNGSEGSTAPVKWKDGRQVEAKFDLALHYGKTAGQIVEAKRPKWWMPPIIP